MKAAVFRAFSRDPKEVVKIEDIDTPRIKSNEVLIEIQAAAYNYNDLWAIWGEPIKVSLPHISGSDAAGTVIETGPDIETVKIGDRVVSHSNMSCRVCSLCTSGREFDCANRRIWGFETGPLWGSFAQFTHLPEVNIAKIPNNLSFENAAAVSMVGMTAWHMLVGRAKIKPGQTVLIMGGGSGIGTVGIQIAKLFGCTVLATAGTKDKMEKCESLGADFVANHRENNWHKSVREFVGKEGIDIVFEHIGKNVFAQEVSLLKKGGTLVTSGATTGYEGNFDLRYLFFKGTNLLGSTQGTRAELEEVINWTGKGRITPIIDEILPFSKMVEGHLKMSQSALFGKIVTTPQKM